MPPCGSHCRAGTAFLIGRLPDMGLQTYRAKRNFDVTSEPRGRKAAAAGHAFVIQKHAARQLHYDLRLELDGVMKSWAVTRGPSLVPGEKRLAVQVEDHPIEYNSFEGTIPQGEYGGGTVMIWDRGTWQPEGDPHKALKKGQLTFMLDGEKLKGAWHLVRLRGRPGETKANWLLIKSKDEMARTANDPDILEERPLSAVTGRSSPEIAEGKGRKRVWHSNRSVKDNVKAAAAGNGAAAKRVTVKRTAARKSTAKRATAKPASAKRSKSARAPRRAGAAKKAKAKSKRPMAGSAPLPDFVPLCLATLSETAPDGADWVHEIKFDGYRIQARLDHGEVRLLTRKALDWAQKFPRVAKAVKALPARQALLDGEIISETESGVSSFSQLQQDLSEGHTERMVYFAFDLLHLDGRDWTGAPLIERKQALQELLADPPADAPIRFSEHFEEPGPAMLQHACRLSLEGIISKRRNVPYRSGRGGDWLKTKCSDRQEFVVVGFAPSTVDAKAIGALILGYYDKGELRYAGRSGTGYTHKVARDLWRRLQPLRQDKPPFGKVPPEETRARNAKWVQPKLVVEINFHGWTHGDRVRQASFQGLREDKSPKEIVREKKVMAPASRKSVAAAATARASVVRAPKTKKAGSSS